MSSVFPDAAQPVDEKIRGHDAPGPFRAFACVAGACFLAMLLPVPKVPTPFGDAPVNLVSISAAALALMTLMTLIRSPHVFGPGGRRVAAFSLVVLIAMAVPVVARRGPIEGMVGYLNFAVAVVGGTGVGLVWHRLWRRVSAVDLGLAGFIVGAVIQISVDIATREGANLATKLALTHQQMVLTWGGSNYVAAVLLLAALLAGARVVAAGLPWWTYIVPAAGVLGSTALLSRGAAIACLVGLACAVWLTTRTVRRRALWLVAGLALDVVYFVVTLAAMSGRFLAPGRTSDGGMDGVVDVLSSTAASPAGSQNINARVDLIKAAWRQFTSNPLTGSGWWALRAEEIAGAQISYAHNLFLSFLQIAGVAGGVALIVLAVLGWSAFRGSLLIAPFLIAASVLLMTDPIMESTNGGQLIWAASSAGTALLYRRKRHDDDLQVTTGQGVHP